MVKKSKVRNKSVTTQRGKVPNLSRWGAAYTAQLVRPTKATKSGA